MAGKAHPELAKALGAAIKARRRELGLVQADIADALAFHFTRVPVIEAGRYVPSLPLLIAFARVLSTTPDALLIAAGVDLSPTPIEPKPRGFSVAPLARALAQADEETRARVRELLKLNAA